MYKIRKGSVISESCYGFTIVSTIVSEVEVVNGDQQKFTTETDRGGKVEYLVGGTYGSHINILEY